MTNNELTLRPRDQLIDYYTDILRDWKANNILEDHPYKAVVVSVHSEHGNWFINAFRHLPAEINDCVDIALEYFSRSNFRDISDAHASNVSLRTEFLQAMTIDQLKNKVNAISFSDEDKKRIFQKLSLSSNDQCSECGGTAEYVGLNSVEPCKSCGGQL